MDAGFKSCKTLQLSKNICSSARWRKEEPVFLDKAWCWLVSKQMLLCAMLSNMMMYSAPHAPSTLSIGWRIFLHYDQSWPLLEVVFGLEQISINSMGLAAWLDLPASLQGWFNSLVPPDLVQSWELTFQWSNTSLPARVGQAHIF